MVACIAVLYVSLYFATVEIAADSVRNVRETDGIWVWEAEPKYGGGGNAAYVSFCPIHEFDRLLRPRAWWGGPPDWRLFPELQDHWQ